MAQVKIDIRGAKEIDKALSLLPIKVERKVLGGAARDGGKVVLAAAKQNTPVLTGTLQQSVKIKAAKGMPKSARGVVVGVGAKWFTGPTYYGAFVEFGHKLGKRQGRGKLAKLNDRRKQIPGEHMIEYAFDEVGTAAVGAVVEGIRSRIDDAITEARKDGGA